MRNPMLPYSTVIANLAQLREDWQAVADLQEENLVEMKASVGLMLYDVLFALGMPENGIRMTLGHELYQAIRVQRLPDMVSTTQSFTCCLCPDLADAMGRNRHGELRFLCFKDAQALREHGYEILPAIEELTGEVEG